MKTQKTAPIVTRRGALKAGLFTAGAMAAPAVIPASVLEIGACHVVHRPERSGMLRTQHLAEEHKDIIEVVVDEALALA